MKGKEAEELLLKIEEAFGLTKHDFQKDVDGYNRPIYTQWGNESSYISIDDLGDSSLKISKNLGEIYIEKIRTNKWVVVGEGTTLHCDDIEAGEEIVEDFGGYLM